jgi:DNA replication initiation complex subunit (GINS family)
MKKIKTRRLMKMMVDAQTMYIATRNSKLTDAEKQFFRDLQRIRLELIK